MSEPIRHLPHSPAPQKKTGDQLTDLLKEFIKEMEAILEMHPLVEDAHHLSKMSNTLIRIDGTIKSLPEPFKEIGESLDSILSPLLKSAHSYSAQSARSSELHRIAADHLHHPDATHIMLHELRLISHELEHPPSHPKSA